MLFVREEVVEVLAGHKRARFGWEAEDSSDDELDEAEAGAVDEDDD